MSKMRQVYEAEFDFPIYLGRPKLTYMVAGIPRSGSTHFTLDLWRTGLLGAPLEYVNFLLADGIYERLGGNGPAGPEGYWRALEARRTSLNGVFGFKAFIQDLTTVGENYTAMLPLIAPSHIIYITRRDKLAQTVSYARASQTRAWYADAPAVIEPSYDPTLLVKAEEWINNQNASWERLFRMKRIEPLRVFHEDFVDAPDEVMSRVSDYLCVPLDPAAAIPVPTVDKQADAINRDWSERFVAERAATLTAQTAAQA